MKTKLSITVIFALLCMLVFPSCFLSKKSSLQKENIPKNIDLAHIDFTVSEAPAWTSLFYRNSGWLGADGIFSIPLNGVNANNSSDSTLLIFSDTMIGEVVDSQLHKTSGIVNNTVAYIKGIKPEKDKIHFYYKKTKEGATSFFRPNTPHAQEKDYYWLGDGFINQALDDNIYFFAYRMRNMNKSDWSFRQVGNTLIVLNKDSRPPFNDQRQIETPFLINGHGDKDTENGSLGAGIFVNTKAAGAPSPDGYVYVYGVKGSVKNLIVARVKPKDFENFKKWRFWDGETWNADLNRIAYVTTNVSNELSVSPLPDGRYALIFQVGGMSSKVGLRLGASPHGPFGPIITLWNCTEGKRKNYYTYNAKAHPALSKPGELLISYNVNAFDFFNEIKQNPHLYRPRFIKVKFGKDYLTKVSGLIYR